MKFTIRTKDLRDALGFVAPVARGRVTLPILNYVLIEAAEKLRLTCDSLAMRLTATAETTATEPGATCVPAEKLVKIAQLAQVETVEFSTEKNGRLNITAGNFKSVACTLPAEDFPPAQVQSESKPLPITLAQLRKLSPTMYPGIERLFLNGVCVSNTGIFATDGRRLHVITGDYPGDYIIPFDCVRYLCGLDLEAVECAINSERFACNSQNRTLLAKLIEGSPPNWKQVVPEKSEPNLIIERESFIHAVQCAMLGTDEKAMHVTIEVRDGQVFARGSKPDFIAEDGIEAKRAKFDKFSVNPAYLLDTLNVLESDIVEIQVTDELSPFRIDEGDFTAVLVPMRID